MSKNFYLILAVLLVWAGQAYAQVRSVTGVVISEEDGLPVVGASVWIAGTSSGTVTDTEGKFSIEGIPDAEGKKLQVSFVGMRTQTLAIKSGVMKIYLKPDEKLLDEVVVVAYGTARKSSLTGAVSSVDAGAIEKTIGTSATGALEGSSPGIQVNNTYGEPGADPLVRIRGIGSVNGNNEPLYVVDGAPYDGKIADLNAADIESMTVLKDASSAALYGNRAANGVILITTKKAGRLEKPTVTFTTNQGAYARGIREYDRLGTTPWMETQWTGLKNYARSLASLGYGESEAAAYATSHLIGDLIKYNIFDAADNALFDGNGKLTARIRPGYTDLDWADEMERTGYRQEYGLGFSTAGEKYNLYASLGYLNEKGYIINTDFERYSARINSTFNPVKWFKGGLNVAATSQNHNYNLEAYSTYAVNPFYTLRYLAPVYPIYRHDADGSFLLDGKGEKEYNTTADYLSNRHLIYEQLNNKEKDERLTVNANAFVTFVLPYGFDLTVKGTRNYTDRKRSKFENPDVGPGASVNGRLSDYNYRFTTTNFQQQLNWSREYGLHHVDALLGHESYEFRSSLTYGVKTDMSLTGNSNLINFNTINTYTGYADKDATESYLARARYNFDNRYFFETSFRRDGSSRFHKNNRWGDFFSVGAAWDITKEKFMADTDWIDYLKLRASYGETGNNSIGTTSRDGLGYNTNYYAYQALYYLAQNGGKGALVEQSLSAEGLKWETTQTVDVALEGHLFDRLDFSAGYFNRRSKDLLFAVPLAASNGSFVGNTTGNYNLTQLQNIGSVVNRGWELSFGADLIRNRDWKWNVGLDATFLTNKIKQLPGGKDIADGSLKRYAEGHSIYEFYTYHFEGVDQLTGNSLYTLDPEQAEKASQEKKVVTIGGEEYTTDVTYGKKDWAGSALPDVYGSFHTGVEWKGLSLNVLMTYSLGGKVYDSGYQSLMSTSASGVSALHKDVLKSWSGVPAGMSETSADRIDAHGIPVVDHNLSLYNNANSDRWLTDASYLVLKNITLAYDLPRHLVQSWGLQHVTVNAGVENAFTVTARQGLNPQYSFNGLQDATYTTARIFNIGAKLVF